MYNKIDMMKIKKNIKLLIENGNIDEAKVLISQYEVVEHSDADLYAIKSVLAILDDNLIEAEKLLKSGLKINDQHFDLLYNLAFLYQTEDKVELAIEFYKRALRYSDTIENEKETCLNLRALGVTETKEEIIDNIIVEKQKKIVFFYKVGMDSFIDEVIEVLSENYEVEKVQVSSYAEIDQKISDSAINWFEWCDELISYASKLENASRYTIICRLHSYEAFTDQIRNVNWSNVNKVIFIAPHIRKYVLENSNLDKSKTVIIPNGVDFSKWKFKKRNHGFNIAYVGYINYKKGPMLLLQSIHEIVERDSRYILHIAGKFQDPRDLLYFNQMIPILGLANNVRFHGWISDLDEWLEDKNYILCTSILESQNMSVMQAMAKGIKPLIHNFVGAENIYSKKYLWNDFRELIALINDNYNSKEYKMYIEERYLSDLVFKELKLLCYNLVKSEFNGSMSEYPRVTIGVTSYNDVNNLKKCVQSILNQNYPNLEIIISDDGSTDASISYLEELSKKNLELKVLTHIENSGGASRGIKEIISKHTGKYLQWIACDDMLLPNSIISMASVLEKNPNTDYVFSDLTIINQDDVKQNQWRYSPLSPNEIAKNIFMRNGSGVIPINGMIRSYFLKENNLSWTVYKDNDYSVDTINVLQYSKYNWSIEKTDFSVIAYRIHDNNLSKNLKRRIHGMKTIVDYIFDNFQLDIFLDSENIDVPLNYLNATTYYQTKKYIELTEMFLNLKNSDSYINFGDEINFVRVYLEEIFTEIEDKLIVGLQDKIIKNNYLKLQEKYWNLKGGSRV